MPPRKGKPKSALDAFDALDKEFGAELDDATYEYAGNDTDDEGALLMKKAAKRAPPKKAVPSPKTAKLLKPGDSVPIDPEICPECGYERDLWGCAGTPEGCMAYRVPGGPRTEVEVERIKAVRDERRREESLPDRPLSKKEVKKYEALLDAALAALQAGSKRIAKKGATRQSARLVCAALFVKRALEYVVRAGENVIL